MYACIYIYIYIYIHTYILILYIYIYTCIYICGLTEARAGSLLSGRREVPREAAARGIRGIPYYRKKSLSNE